MSTLETTTGTISPVGPFGTLFVYTHTPAVASVAMINARTTTSPLPFITIPPVRALSPQVFGRLEVDAEDAVTISCVAAMLLGELLPLLRLFDMEALEVDDRVGHARRVLQFARHDREVDERVHVRVQVVHPLLDGLDGTLFEPGRATHVRRGLVIRRRRGGPRVGPPGVP